MPPLRGHNPKFGAIESISPIRKQKLKIKKLKTGISNETIQELLKGIGCIKTCLQVLYRARQREAEQKHNPKETIQGE